MDRAELVLAVIAAKQAKQGETPVKYLEIGVGKGDVFKQVWCYRLGLDPSPEVDRPDVFRMTSDEYFELIAGEEDFDVVFIDGDHKAEQVAKDITNCLRWYPDAVILLHDTNPLTADATSPDVRGDGFKVCDWIRKETTTLKLFTTELKDDFMTAIMGNVWDNGEIMVSPITFAEFEMDRDGVLNFVTNEEFIEGCL